MNIQNNNPLEQLEQIINSIQQLINNETNELNISPEDLETLKQLHELLHNLNQEIPAITGTLREINTNLANIQTKNTDTQTQQQILPIGEQQALEGLKTQLQEIDNFLKSIYGNTDKSLYDLYDIYRDHIKHEDNLGNQRMNILLASQSFLFFPYFGILKDYRNNGYSGYDLFLLLFICILGIGINLIVRPSILGFIDASSHIRNQWKQILYETDNSKKNVKKYNTEFNLSQLGKTKQPITDLDTTKQEDEDYENIGFITLDGNNYIPNIGYENPEKKRRDNINKCSNKLFLWLIGIWGVSIVVPFVFPLVMPPASKSLEEVKLEKILNKIYEAELNKKIVEEKQNTENKTKNDLQGKLEKCKNEIINANPPMTNSQIKKKLDSCFK